MEQSSQAAPHDSQASLDDKRACVNCHFLKVTLSNEVGSLEVGQDRRRSMKHNDYTWKLHHLLGCCWGLWDENKPRFQGDVQQLVTMDRGSCGTRYLPYDATMTLTGALDKIKWDDRQKEERVTRWIALAAIFLTLGALLISAVDFYLKIINWYPSNIIVNTVVSTVQVVVTATPHP